MSIFEGNILTLLDNGPFCITFKKKFKDKKKPVYSYFQVDGEFMKLVRPKKLIIRHSEDLPNGKIKILVKIEP